MICVSDYIQLKAFARIEGLLFGLLWVFTFGCLIASLDDVGLSGVASACIAATPIVAFFRLRRFRDKVLGGSISFRRGFAYLAFSFAYASLIVTAATYVYFAFIDNGDFLMSLQRQLLAPETQQSFRQAGVDASVLRQELDLLSSLRPIDIAISVLSNTLASGAVLAAALGFLCRKRRRIWPYLFTNNQKK